MLVTELRFSDSINVATSPEHLYDLVSDISRMGEWSPICTACWWNDGDGPRVGAWFTGRNETAESTWETKSQITAAERGREFTFQVGGSFVRWSYTFAPIGEGAILTESWEFLPDGIAFFHKNFGDDAEAQIANRARDAREGIPQTLAAIKVTAEAK